MKLEVCANSFHSAKNAQLAGAHRIELCQELTVGGLTPSYGLLKEVLEKLHIETFVLIRPRSGDFFYTEEEFEIMKQDLIQYKKMGCHGIVSGVLLENGNVDLERTKELVELSSPLPFTFHRAFDCTPDSLSALRDLKSLGVTRILTSGQRPSAEKGLELLKQLKLLADEKIIIMPGSGIHAENIKVFKEAGFQEVHASASKALSRSKSVHPFYAIEQTVSDAKKIQSLIKQME